MVISIKHDRPVPTTFPAKYEREASKNSTIAVNNVLAASLVIDMASEVERLNFCVSRRDVLWNMHLRRVIATRAPPDI
jgi:hypothetical protein